MARIKDAQIILQDGVYDAIWGGYHLEILLPNDDKYITKTDIGVKTPRAEIKVEVVGGIIHETR